MLFPVYLYLLLSRLHLSGGTTQDLPLCQVAAGLEIQGQVNGWTCNGSVPVTPVCNWDKVFCDVNGSVTQIWLNNVANYSITGTLSTFIGQLTSLRQLSVDFSDLRGTIPTEIGRIKMSLVKVSLIFARQPDELVVH